MSVIEHPDSINPPDLQIWNNAAFDNGGSEESSIAVKSSWSLLQFKNMSQSIESDMSKENMSPNLVKPLNQIANPQSKKPLKPVPRIAPIGSEIRDERRIDSEIEEIESEIWRLSTKLEALRIEKLDRTVKSSVEKKGRAVPARFNLDPPIAQSRPSRRGFSLGPAEIAARTRQFGKPEIMPVEPVLNRRRSCLWKLQEIDERGQRLSLSPKSRRSKIQPPKQSAATSVGQRKVSKREDSVIASVQPKKLFGDKPGTAKKPVRAGRVVPSRYSQIQSSASSIASERKRSLPEDGNEEALRNDKRRVSMAGSEVRAKKKWEVPGEVVVCNAVEGNVTVTVSSPPLAGGLPRIRTRRCGNGSDSPRDSGAAKRVAELVGRRSVFSAEEEEEELHVCQALTFGDDAEEE